MRIRNYILQYMYIVKFNTSARTYIYVIMINVLIINLKNF